jgi:hypothetical protein
MAGSVWQIGRTRDFRGGETQATLPEEVGRNQLLRMENAMIFPDGRITASHQADTVVVSNATLGLAIVSFPNGYYNVFSASGDGNVRSNLLNTASATPVDMTAGNIHSVDGARIVGVSRAVNFLGKNYCANPNTDDTKDGILNLSDFTLTSVPTPGTGVASKLKLYVNRLWLLSTDGKLNISDNGDAAAWNPLNVLLLPNSEPVVDFHPVPGGAIVYSNTAIYAMYGSTYQDITFIPLMQSGTSNPKQFTSGSVEVGGVVYILSDEGVYQVSLNGAQLVPHHQERFFRDNYSIFSDKYKTITAVHLKRHNAILYTWPSSYGNQSLIFYLTGATSKINRGLPVAYPYIVGMNDGNTDYLVGTAAGTLAKSEYPSSEMSGPEPSIIQTRHEDCDSYRDKVWSEFVMVVGEVVYGVTIQAILDEATTLTVVEDAALTVGENTFWLDELPRSKTLSMVITIDNSAVLSLASDDDPTLLLTDDEGNTFSVVMNPGNWTIKELRLRFRQAGPDL